MHLNVTTVKCSINKYEYMYVKQKQNRQQNNKLINYTLVETSSYNIHTYLYNNVFIYFPKEYQTDIWFIIRIYFCGNSIINDFTSVKPNRDLNILYVY